MSSVGWCRNSVETVPVGCNIVPMDDSARNRLCVPCHSSAPYAIAGVDRSGYIKSNFSDPLPSDPVRPAAEDDDLVAWFRTGLWFLTLRPRLKLGAFHLVSNIILWLCIASKLLGCRCAGCRFRLKTRKGPLRAFVASAPSLSCLSLVAPAMCDQRHYRVGGFRSSWPWFFAHGRRNGPRTDRTALVRPSSAPAVRNKFPPFVSSTAAVSRVSAFRAVKAISLALWPSAGVIWLSISAVRYTYGDR